MKLTYPIIHAMEEGCNLTHNLAKGGHYASEGETGEVMSQQKVSHDVISSGVFCTNPIPLRRWPQL